MIKWINNIRIEFQRWNFRRQLQSGGKADLENQLKAIEKAKKLSSKRKSRLWVIRLLPGKYRICSKGDLKSILRNLGMKQEINIYQVSDPIVYITNRRND